MVILIPFLFKLLDLIQIAIQPLVLPHPSLAASGVAHWPAARDRRLTKTHHQFAEYLRPGRAHCERATKALLAGTLNNRFLPRYATHFSSGFDSGESIRWVFLLNFQSYEIDSAESIGR